MLRSGGLNGCWLRESASCGARVRVPLNDQDLFGAVGSGLVTSEGFFTWAFRADKKALFGK